MSYVLVAPKGPALTLTELDELDVGSSILDDQGYSWEKLFDGLENRIGGWVTWIPLTAECVESYGPFYAVPVEKE